jgi:osmotically-inducible protein OsmY
MLSAIVGLAACGGPDPDPAETAGQALGDATRTAGNAVADAAGKAGQAIGDAAEKTGQAISDTALTTKIKASILAESGLSVTEIEVETTNGAVTLMGTVNSKADSDKVASIATETAGVKSVDNQLHVSTTGGV